MVHLHIPKTAGTSLNRKLLPLYERSERVDAHGGDPTAKLKAMDPEARAAIRLVAGHCAHGIHRILTPPVQYLCILREPGPRILSYYRFIMRTGVPPNWTPMLDKRPDFGGFLIMAQEIPQLWNELDNGQTRRLAGRMKAQQVDRALYDTACTNLLAENMLFGLTETFPDFLRRLAALDILPDTDNLRANSAPESGDFERARVELTAEQADLLARFTAWDDKLYDHARQALASRAEIPA